MSDGLWYLVRSEWVAVPANEETRTRQAGSDGGRLSEEERNRRLRGSQVSSDPHTIALHSECGEQPYLYLYLCLYLCLYGSHCCRDHNTSNVMLIISVSENAKKLARPLHSK